MRVFINTRSYVKERERERMRAYVCVIMQTIVLQVDFKKTRMPRDQFAASPLIYN